MSDKKDFLFLARAAEQTERFEGSIHCFFPYIYIYCRNGGICPRILQARPKTKRGRAKHPIYGIQKYIVEQEIGVACHHLH